MANIFPSKETLERLREQYPEGIRVELVSMDDPHSTLRPGDRGSVSGIDDTGTIFVKWDKGSSLGLVYGVDSFKLAPREIAYATGAEMWRDTVANNGVDEAAVICGRFLDTSMKREHSDGEARFCRELFTEMFEATAGKTNSDKIVYPYDLPEAAKREEKPFYAASAETNNECARAINAAISASCYKTNYYHLDFAVMSVVREYGFERMNAVLAGHIQRHSRSDGRISQANRDWASDFQLPGGAFTEAFLNAHAILVDGFARHAREMYAELNAERFALPGREESGEMNEGYEVVRAVTFSDKSGYAIGQSLENADDCVTWQFMIRDGARNYNHGYYSGDLKSAEDNYLARVAVHMSDGVREIPNPIAAVEINAEQNFNMIDGINNNAASAESSAEPSKQEPAQPVETPPQEAKLGTAYFLVKWQEKADAIDAPWREDERYRADKEGALFYKGGESGYYICASNDGTFTVGWYERANPGIENATFSVDISRHLPTYNQALILAVSLGGEGLAADLFGEAAWLAAEVEANRQAAPVNHRESAEIQEPDTKPQQADGYTSVLAAIEKGKTVPKPPRKAKSQAKTKDGEEI